MIRIRVRKDKAVLEIKGIGNKLRQLRPVFIDFSVYMQRRLVLMFSKLKRGGTFRGATWQWFAPQYRRQDGTIVPAEGIPGEVQGRKRPSGKRVTRQSSLLQDTGRLRNSLLGQVNIRSGTRLAMDTPVQYAEYQHNRRPFQFFEDPADLNMLRNMIIRRLSLE